MDQVRKVVPEAEPSRINLHAYWKVFWRKKFYLVVPLVLSTAIAVTGARRLTPIYESRTMIAIEDKNILGPTMDRFVQPSADHRDQLRNQRYRAMIETRLKSNDFLRLVIEDLGIQRSSDVQRYMATVESKSRGDIPLDELVMRRLVGTLKKKIEVQNPTGGFFTVGVYDTDPATAFVLAGKVAEKFIEVTRQDQIQGVRQAGAFSDEQLAIYKDKLDASEKELSRVRRELASAEVANNPVNETNIHYAQALRQTVKANADRSDIAFRRVRERLLGLTSLVPTSDRITGDESIRAIENRLVGYGEEKLLRDLTGSSQAEMPVAQFDDATAALRNRITELVQVEYGAISPDIHPLIIEYYYQRSLNDYYASVDRKLRGYLDQYSNSYERRPALERESSRLAQEVETNRAIYKAFLDSKTSARVTEAVQSTNLGLSMTIIERAEKPIEPVKPDPIKIILLAVLFGAACGIGAILITEYLDDSFRSIDEVERELKVPVLGTVPKMAEGFSWEKRQRGVVVVSWFVGIVLFVGVMSGALYLYASYLKSSGLGVELIDARPPAEVQR